ncbi:MAG: hypothetical protein FWD66_03480 [Paludibacter sp.]|nr:hypothetical protein [Paludibacter sp.]
MSKINFESIAKKMSDKEMKTVRGGSIVLPTINTFRLADNGGGGSSSCGGTKVTACEGSRNLASCCFTYNGKIYYGRCQAFAPNYVLHCSDLN